MADDIQRVGVIGLGTMGAGIVEVFARAGLAVTGVETTTEYADRGREVLQGSTDRAVAKGKLDEAGQAQILDRISFSTSMTDLADAQLVVEAIPEVIELKHNLFAELDQIVAQDAILATNTSSLSVTEIAGPTAYPERVIGMHFFNPAPVLELVEVIKTLRTDERVTEAVTQLAGQIGKKPVAVGDRAGFVANYLLFGYFTAALRMLQTGHVTGADLDTAMRVGAGLPMGPLALMDLVGLDVCDHIGEVIYQHSRSPRHAPSPLLSQMVTAGMLGRKSGHGFYRYDKPGSGTLAGSPDSDALAAAASQAAAPAQLGPVGVVGSGVIADALAGRLREGGYEVLAADAAEESELAHLVGARLVIEAQDLLLDVDDPADLDGGDVPGRELDDLFAALGEITGPDTVLTTVNSTSAMAIGAWSGRPQRSFVLQVHEPTGNGQVIEIGHASVADEEAVTQLRGVISKIGAEPVVCRDRVGLVVDALLVPHLNDAVRMLDEGYASVDDIDTALQYGLGYPIGPFAMIDQVGADEVLAIAEELAAAGELPTDAARPSPLLIEYVLLDRSFTS